MKKEFFFFESCEFFDNRRGRFAHFHFCSFWAKYFCVLQWEGGLCTLIALVMWSLSGMKDDRKVTCCLFLFIFITMLFREVFTWVVSSVLCSILSCSVICPKCKFHLTPVLLYCLWYTRWVAVSNAYLWDPLSYFCFLWWLLHWTASAGTMETAKHIIVTLPMNMDVSSYHDISSGNKGNKCTHTWLLWMAWPFLLKMVWKISSHLLSRSLFFIPDDHDQDYNDGRALKLLSHHLKQNKLTRIYTFDKHDRLQKPQKEAQGKYWRKFLPARESWIVTKLISHVAFIHTETFETGVTTSRVTNELIALNCGSKRRKREAKKSKSVKCEPPDIDDDLLSEQHPLCYETQNGHCWKTVSFALRWFTANVIKNRRQNRKRRHTKVDSTHKGYDEWIRIFELKGKMNRVKETWDDDTAFHSSGKRSPKKSR